MENNEQRTRHEEGPIEERLIDGREESQDSIVSAAEDAFVEDQKSPDHPSRIERKHDVEDPSHSQGI